MFEITLPYGGINRIRFIGYDLRGNGNHNYFLSASFTSYRRFQYLPVK